MASENDQIPPMGEHDADQPTSIENLYIGQFEDVVGKINGQLDCPFRGEVLIYRRAEGETFQVETVRRVALYGMPDPAEDEAPLGIISLAGPVAQAVVPDAESPTQFRANLQVQLHYYGLPDLDPTVPNSDAVFPATETIKSNLSLRWDEALGAEEQTVQLIAELNIAGVINAILGKVQSIEFAPFPLVFHLAGSQPEPEVKPHSSLTGCTPSDLECPADKSSLPFNQKPGVIHQLKLRFINVSNTPLATVEQGCQNQIAGACEVWGRKAAINLDVHSGNIDAHADLKTCYAVADDTKQKSLPCAYARSLTSGVPPCGPDPCQNAPTDPDPDHVEVYIVQQILGVTGGGGGITRNAAQASAYCILEAGRLSSNRYLLAHELGHVLGLTHPEDPLCAGSWQSVIQAAPAGQANSSVNTRENCRILEPSFATNGIQPCLILLNPICRATESKRNYCLDA